MLLSFRAAQETSSEPLNVPTLREVATEIGGSLWYRVAVKVALVVTEPVS
jgi:hypothetical protein